MAGSKILLDTNVVIALLNRDSAITNGLTDFDEVYLPSIVVGELFLGAMRSHRVEDNISRVESFCRDCAVLNVNASTGRQYGEVKSRLMKAGRPIPDNDVWIAAISLQHAIPLLTRDRHFQSVDSLNATIL